MRADRPMGGARLDKAWDVLGSGLLLFFALGGALISFFSIYTVDGGALSLFYAEYGTARLLGYAAALSLGALLVWSLPRFRLPVVAVLTGAWAWTVWLFRERFSAGALLTAQSASDLFADRVGWTAPMRLELGLFALEETEAVETFTLLAAAMLALLLGLFVVRFRRWWAVLLLTLTPLLPGLLSDVYPEWPAFLALAACWCAMLVGDLCRNADPAPRGKLTLLLLAAVGGLLAAVYLLSPQEDWRRPQWTHTAEQTLVDFGNKYLSFLSDMDGPFRPAATYVGSAERVDLREAGPLHYTGRTVLKVTGDYTGRVYLRGSSLSLYSGGIWAPMEPGVYQAYAERVEREGFYGGSPLLFAGHCGSNSPYTVTVENTGASGACVYAPYQLEDQDWKAAGLLPVEDSYLAHERNMWSHAVTFSPLPDIPEWLSSKPKEVERSENVYRSLVVPHYQNIPEELRHFFREDFRDAEFFVEYYSTENGRRLALAGGIAAMLAERFEYDPDVPAAPEGEDPVVWFLTESHRGYCMHFASAATLLLRHMEVPARYVSGFTAELAAGETVNVPDSAAHAWVEIYLDGYGWYPVEVTPDYVPPEPDGTEDPEASPSAEPSQEPSERPEVSPEPEDTPTPSVTQAPGGPGASDDSLSHFLSGVLTAFRWVAATTAVAVLIWLGQWLPRRVRAMRLNDPDANRAALYGYRCLTRLERWGGSVPETALELARKARFSQHTITEEERGAVLKMVDYQRRRLGEALRQPKKLLFHYWWGWPVPAKNTRPEEERPHDDP